jgi:hypothetical protein
MPGTMMGISAILSHRALRWTILLWAAVVRLFVVFRLGHPSIAEVGADVFAVCWGMMPYCALAWFVKEPLNRVVAAVLAIAIAAWDVSVVRDVMHSTRSTASLGLFFQPLWATILVVPVGWWLYRAAQGK